MITENIYNKENPNNKFRWDKLHHDYQKNNWSVPNAFLEVLQREKNNIKDLSDIDIFIETGTSFGNTTELMSGLFKEVYTIEKFIDEEKTKLYNKISETRKNIKFLTGDSANVLKDISGIVNNKRCVILLDAHNGYQTPIKEELKIIKQLYNNKSVIIIDDTCDTGKGDWPTITELKQSLLDINPEAIIKDTGLERNILISY